MSTVNSLILEKCSLAGEVFEISADDYYNPANFLLLFVSRPFIDEIMSLTDESQINSFNKTDFYKRILSAKELIPDWDENFHLLDTREKSVAYWIGYLFMYWFIKEPIDLPLERFVEYDWYKICCYYNILHSLSCDRAIDDIKGNFKRI